MRKQRVYADTLFTFRSNRKQCIRLQCCWHRTANAVYICDTQQNGAISWRRGDKLLNKVVIFVFFAHKKYSRSFVKLRLNHWCHMDYFNDLLATFLSLDHVRIFAVYMEGQRALRFHKRNLNLCSEDERWSYGFGTTWGWVINDRIFIFGELSL